MKQSIRDFITGELSLEYFAKRYGEGWKVASIEWYRESAEANAPVESASILGGQATVPYGFQISEDGVMHENPLEATVLLLILEQIIKEKRIQEIARELNLHGYATREGTAWSASDVFNLLPRLIEAGPSLLKSTAWQNRRPVTQSDAPKTN